MTVVFDAEPLLAFAFDERGADEVSRWLDRVYDGERNGYVSTVNLAEFRYVSTRRTSEERADVLIEDLRELGLRDYEVDGLWEAVSELKATYNPSIGDAYAVAAARALDAKNDRTTVLLVGADDDYDVFENTDGFEHLVERFRDAPA